MTDEEMCRLLRDDRLEFLEFAPEIAARLEALRAERDAATARAEKAEAEVARLREAGVRFCDDFVSRFSEPLTEPERAMLRAAAKLRAALAPVAPSRKPKQSP